MAGGAGWAMGQALIIIGKVLFVAIQPIAVGMAALTLPGSVLVVVSALLYSLACGWQRPTWPVLVTLVALAVVAETLDNVLSMFGVRRFGGSRRTAVAAGIGALGGAIIAGLLFSWLGIAGLLAGLAGWLVTTVVPPVLGAVAGGFLVAYWLERRHGKADHEALRAGWGALLGRVLGAIAKTVLTIAMAAIALAAAFWPR